MFTKVGCTCHSATATKGIGLTIELDSSGISTSHYKGGMSYTVKLTGTNNDTFLLPGFGFQIGAIVGSTPSKLPTNAGTWNPPFPTNTHYAAPAATYYEVGVMEHRSELNATTGNGGKGSTYIETFNWIAPPAGTGTISMWAVLNAIHAVNGTPGDKWDTTHIVLNERKAPTVNVPDNGSNEFTFSVYPNPAEEKTILEVSKNATIQFIDMDGTIILSSPINANQQQVISTENIANGIYTLKVVSTNFVKIRKIVIAK
jgi:Secretion system C-terminal sorting domain